MPKKIAHYLKPHQHRGRYYNHADERYHPFLVPSLSMLIECYWNSFKKKDPSIEAWHNPVSPLSRSQELVFTWIGHSTFLIQAGHINIITDPVFGDLPLFKRQLKPGLEMHDIPEIDYVLISHNHRDHMDAQALEYFKKHPRTHFLVPRGDKNWFEKRGFERVTEYNWWEQDIFKHANTQVTFSFLPAHHWSQRGLLDFNKSLWGSWMISLNGHDLYFAGDTAYASHFSAINREFPTISYAFMPIGPCEPRKFMSHAHVSAEEAGQAFLDLQAQFFVPMHWGAYSFGTDKHTGPYERLLAWWEQIGLSGERLITLKAGERGSHAEGVNVTRSIIPSVETEQSL